MGEPEAIRQLQRGDIGGLEILVRRYQQPALKAVFLVSRDYALAEDIVQAAFLRAYERIDQFDASRPFGPWFLRSVVNDALMAVTRRRHVSLDMVTATEPALQRQAGPALDDRLLAAERQEEVWAALEQLAPAQRAAVVLRYFLGYSDADLARRLEVPAGTIRRRLYDARRRLRQILPA